MIYQGISNTPITRSLVTYPYVWWDNIFTNDELSLVASYFERHGTEEGGVGSDNALNKSIRSSKVKLHTLNNENKWIFDRINIAVTQINGAFYGFDLNGYDQIQYAEYHAKDKGKYDWHMDMSLGERPMENIVQTRKLSLTILLNEPGKDFQGGELEIATAPSDVQTAETCKGRVVAFPSWMQHRVTPVTKGIRKSLAIWILGPKFK